jgi:type II secretory pathway component GspD/PulD (secretin)
LGVSTESVQFIDTGILLEIIPYIGDDGNVLLNVKPSITSAQLDEGIPVTRTTLVETWLLARSGETVLIGGLIQDSVTRTRSEVPCLGNIPLLGLVFGRRGKSVEKVELVILITPRVVDRDRRSLAEWEAVNKIKKAEEKMKKEPFAPHRQMIEFAAPWDRSTEVDAGVSEKSTPNENESKPAP